MRFSVVRSLGNLSAISALVLVLGTTGCRQVTEFFNRHKVTENGSKMWDPSAPKNSSGKSDQEEPNFVSFSLSRSELELKTEAKLSKEKQDLHAALLSGSSVPVEHLLRLWRDTEGHRQRKTAVVSSIENRIARARKLTESNLVVFLFGENASIAEVKNHNSESHIVRESIGRDWESVELTDLSGILTAEGFLLFEIFRDDVKDPEAFYEKLMDHASTLYHFESLVADLDNLPTPTPQPEPPVPGPTGPRPPVPGGNTVIEGTWNLIQNNLLVFYTFEGASYEKRVETIEGGVKQRVVYERGVYVALRDGMLNLTPDFYGISIHSDSMARAYEARTMFGISDWQLNQVYEMTSRMAGKGGIPAKGATVSHPYRLDGENLTIGSSVFTHQP